MTYSVLSPRSTFICLLLAVATACGASEPASIDVEQALDALEVSQNESALFVTLLDGLDPTLSPDLAAQKAADEATSVYSPASCVKATPEGNIVRFVFTACNGSPWNAPLSGVLAVVYTSTGVAGDGMHVGAFTDDLRIGRFDVEIDSEAHYTLAFDARNLTVKTSGVGVTALGHRIERKGSYAVTWNPVEKCIAFDGDIDTRIDERDFGSSVDGFVRCKGSCPEPGGEIVYENRTRDASLRITFDGTAFARWSSSAGKSGTIRLQCSAGA